MSESEGKQDGVVWILVDHSSREAAFESVAELLRDEGAEAHIVTISEVLGSVARDALSGGAERLLRGLRVAVRGRGQDEDLLGAVKRARPDLLAITRPRYVRSLGVLSSLSGIDSLQVGVFVDYDYDAAWTRSSLQAFVVPHEAFRDRLVDDGFPSSRVLVGGPAIQKRFARELDRDALRKEFGFGEERVVLVRAETFDQALLEKLVFQGTLVDTETRFVFHHNGDGAIASTLRRAASQYGLKAAMFGRVSDLERYVVTADAVIASAADPFVPEILALDRPLLFAGPDQGATAQIDFLTDVGAASWVEDVLRLGSEIDTFLDDEKLQGMSEAAAELSETRGSEEVAEALLEALRNRAEWIHAPAPPVDVTGGPDDEGGDEEEEPTETGPFETIGEETPSGETEDTGTRERSWAGVSKAEAKDQLAALILTERDIERKLTETEKQQERWRNRLEMAREWEEDDLAEEAEAILRGYIEEAEQLEKERASILRQKQKLKEAALGGEAAGPESTSERLAGMERRFRDMEVDSDLDDLKDRIRRELGD
jgi:hypothetical protein